MSYSPTFEVPMPCIVRLLERTLLIVFAALLGQAVPAVAQDRSMADPGGPRFLLASASSGKRVEVDVSSVPLFRRRVSLTIEDVELGQVLRAIGRETGVLFSYDPKLAVLERPVTLRAEGLTLAATLTEVLFDSGLDVLVSDQRHLALVPRPVPSLPGSVTGRVTEAKTGQVIGDVEVLLEGTRWRTLTGTDGQYRLAEVDSGTYVVTARRIGYSKRSRSVIVVEGEEVTADFALEQAPTRLEELVTVTPGGIQTQVKTLPSPITVITAEDIERQQPQTFNDVFRQLVPSAVGFDLPAQPATTVLSLRGANSLTGAGPAKVFVDGIESAFGFGNPVDPESIDRIEVIRGPQAATIYGPDAAGGVIQIFTKRGDSTLARPQVTAQAEAGVQETPYEGFRRNGRQAYSASMRGGTGNATFNLGATYSRLSDWLPDDDVSRQSIPSVFGGLSYEAGIIALDVSGRYLITESGTAINPLLLQTGFLPLSQPQFFADRSTNRTVGAGFAVTPTPWWRHRLTVGFDERSGVGTQQRPRLTTPADSLLTLSSSNFGRTSVGYNTELEWAPRSTGIAGTLTAGVDHYRLAADDASTVEALNVDGTIGVAPGGTFNVSRSVTTNNGFFAQLTVGIRERLFITAGVRADDNSTFGTEIGTPVSPRVGVAYSATLGTVGVKARATYGRSIRAPLPGLAFGSVSPAAITLPNPRLAPERQRGWEGGFDVVIGSQVTLSVTGYDQTAENLILAVQVATDPVFTDQHQNVGAVKNRGLEVDGAFTPSDRLQLRGQYAYVKSRIDDLGPTFFGDEQVGDRPRGVPTHTAGGVATFSPWSKTAISGGVTWVGSFRQYDQLALFSCFGGTEPCPASFEEFGSTRDFIVTYPGFAKFNATLSQQITRQIEGILAVDNVTNNLAHEGSNILAVKGRLTSVGMRVRL